MCGNINHRICRKLASNKECEYISTLNTYNPPPRHYKINLHPNSTFPISNLILADSKLFSHISVARPS